MITFLKSIKYIHSLDRLEYEALKRDSLKIKSLFLMILVIAGRIAFLAVIPFVILWNINAIILFLVVAVLLSFLSHYLRLYWTLKRQLGNPFYKK